MTTIVPLVSVGLLLQAWLAIDALVRGRRAEVRR